jgi:hypothetical protein
MAILTTISGVPLFSTIEEALAWGSSRGLSGYHIHNFQGQVGYMGGATHQQASGTPINTNLPQQEVVRTQASIRQPQSQQVNRTSSSGGGGGGY